MITFHLASTGMEDVIHRLEHIRDRLLNLNDLAIDIRDILLEQNRAARMAGLDKDGVEFEPIRASTRRWRSRTGRNPDGPPLAPDGMLSTLVGKARCDITAVGDHHYVIVLHWDGAPWLWFHVEGDGVPVRNPVGITPEGQEAIRAAVANFVLAMLSGD